MPTNGVISPMNGIKFPVNCEKIIGGSRFLRAFYSYLRYKSFIMNYPAHLRYTTDHEWISLEGDVATIGITDFAQRELGDIVYIEVKPLENHCLRMLFLER